MVPGGVHGPGGCMVLGGCLVETPLMATFTGSTHSTGMHSSLKIFFVSPFCEATDTPVLDFW